MKKDKLSGADKFYGYSTKGLIARTKNKNLWAKIMGDLSGKAARNFAALLGDWRSKGWVDVDAYHDAIN